MFPMLVASLITSLVLCCLLIPSVWATLTAADDCDAWESGATRIASRHPFRETGPPACMAKLIMQRHKINQSTTRRRRSPSVSYTRQSARAYTNLAPSRARITPWLRLGRRFGRQNY
ncbi:hypothetical protein GLOTRDRAFT_55836 [Gloeophyllum trabeum ATCC 11539]|uniref:Secreted protein n=1 Tax=Gloeophyllum trabeum (strain ATCC 11539 / FP-39264 / Madison 617) TaxID=670483 RepID=S7QJV4_GLOTA|nr:uncharacterized protein GLOTRDRAFT_55836 [Gloeophyllum trabeum ATCC 11539]EPQ59647.1 hypothetical protein GLOTRDRAFT_55836 [Gloeophyllum trabeum ATCC 11539]